VRVNHRVFRWLEGSLNHLCPKSVAIYARKKQEPTIGMEEAHSAPVVGTPT
jgi:hypothetical protein